MSSISVKESASAPSLHHMQHATQVLRNNCCMCCCTRFSHHSLPLVKEDSCKNLKCINDIHEKNRTEIARNKYMIFCMQERGMFYLFTICIFVIILHNG